MNSLSLVERTEATVRFEGSFASVQGSAIASFGSRNPKPPKGGPGFLSHFRNSTFAFALDPKPNA